MRRSARFSGTVAAALILAVPMLAGAEEAQKPRILSLGGDITEILYDLGQADSIIAIDTTSQYPESALKEKKNVGYLRALSSEGVLAVDPTLIIASDQAGPPEVVAALKGASVRYVEIADKRDEASVPAKIRAVGGVVGATVEAEALARKVEADFAALGEERKHITKAKRALFILGIQNGRATVGGAGTSADSILKLAGAENAAAAVSGYKPVSDEQLTEFAPDTIVIMSRGDGDRHVAEQALRLTGLLPTPAAQTRSLIEMDALTLLGFGPRAPQAARDLMKALYGAAAEAQ